MQPFQPLINLLVLLSTLSIAAERLTNVLKLGRARTRLRLESFPRLAHLAPRPSEKEWERCVSNQALIVSLGLAVLVKADFFAILGHLEAPWDTLGWARFYGSQPTLSHFLYTVGGCVFTGFSMGFGSKFWHDVLDIVYGARARVRKAEQQ